ncbi:conidiophore development hymA [Cordyceps militaris]|uniref:Conidiophore development hymA n=1 Tax=Cordyceps militaris TaxID=73501 RepID=A0A2H4SWH7_CORMI|nr:conidiophore development hymA [Cordyceps militaris]
MSFLFGRARARTAADLPKQAREHVLKLDGPTGTAKVCSSSSSSVEHAIAEELSRVLAQMKVILQGTQGMSGHTPSMILYHQH